MKALKYHVADVASENCYSRDNKNIEQEHDQLLQFLGEILYNSSSIRRTLYRTVNSIQPPDIVAISFLFFTGSCEGAILAIIIL